MIGFGVGLRSQSIAVQLEFIPVEDFYFALTLAVRTLEELENQPIEQVRSHLEAKFGRPSTVAAAQQNHFSYVFRVHGYDNSPADQLIVSISDWQAKLRLSSDYGWMLDENRKPVRTERFERRQEFTQQLRSHLENWLEIAFINAA